MHSSERGISTSVLVIGTGGSGLRAAIGLAERGVDVLAVGKRPRADAHTSLAAGGINAALATIDPRDTWQQHAADTLKESRLLADPRTVQIVTERAARGIEELVRYGMRFAREEDGRISQRFFGAHTFRRTAFAGDYTGLELRRTLVNRAAQLRIRALDTVYITKLLVHNNVIFGAYGFDVEDGARYVIHADAVILAAGGDRIWYRPGPLYVGHDSFQYHVTDGAGDSNIADVSVRVGQEVVVHDFPLDADPGWSTEGQWAWGAPTGGGGPYAYDPTSGFTGPNVYGYNLTGNYPLGMPAADYLTTPPLSTEGYVCTRLEFRRWLGMDSAGLDKASIQASDDGATWGTVWEHRVQQWITESAWSLHSYDISALADERPNVQIRWGIGPSSPFPPAFAGWNLDDIRIYGIPRATSACRADLTSDGVVDFGDYLAFLNLFDGGDLAVDFTTDGVVDFGDYLEFLNLFDAGC